MVAAVLLNNKFTRQFGKYIFSIKLIQNELKLHETLQKYKCFKFSKII